jgi:hypothetical protein
MEVSGQVHISAIPPPARGGDFPGTHWIGGWVSLSAIMGAMEKRKILPLPGIELWLIRLWPITIPAELSRLSPIQFFRQLNIQFQCPKSLISVLYFLHLRFC